MNLYLAHTRGLRALEARLGTDCPMVSWKNLDFAVIPGTALRKAELGAGGLSLNADFRFEALVETWTAQVPTIQTAEDLKNALLRKPINYLGDDYQVEAVTLNAGGLSVMVECSSLNENA